MTTLDNICTVKNCMFLPTPLPLGRFQKETKKKILLTPPLLSPPPPPLGNY